MILDREAPASVSSTVAPAVIRPSSGWVGLRLSELWSYRELLYFLVWRDVKVRYKQTVLGATWALLQPLATMVVFTLFFGRIARVGSEGAPYPVFSLAGILPWTLFATALGQSANSLVGSAALLKKVYFPRLVTPLAGALAGIGDFVIGLGLLLALMLWYGRLPGLTVLWLPLFTVLALLASLGFGLWLSALNAEYRDVRYLVPFVSQLWLFVTPVIYPTSRVIEKLDELGIPAWIYGLNPMAAVVQGFRWALFGSPLHASALLLPGTLVALLLLVSGLFYFRRMERRFTDRL